MSDRIAIQLYTLRELDTDDALELAAEAGYDGVEGLHTPDLDPAATRAALERLNLTMASAHVALETLERDTEAVFDAHREIGNDALAIPWLGPARRGDNADEWRAVGARIGKLAERCRAAGFALLYHHHDFELAEHDGKTGLEHLLDANPELELELDVGWCVAAGVDPLRLIERYAGRLTRVHLKDRAAAGENPDEEGWADVGHGTIDWPPVLAALRDAEVPWWVVEHDAPSDPARTAKRSLAFLREP